MMIIKKPIESPLDLFRPRWVVLDASPTRPLFSQYFWTERGASKALLKEIQFQAVTHLFND